jgi:APA family basic amino acid/polyamine antiporter
MIEPSSSRETASQPRQELSLLDSTSIIVGIIIGSAIYQSSPAIAAGAGRWATRFAEGWGASSSTWSSAAAAIAIVGVWLAGGLIALVGAMCYAELATAYPRAGGTYVFLSEAFGPNVGFAFAWAEFWIVRPGNVGAIAFVLATYARQIAVPSVKQAPLLELSLAAGAIVVLTALNGMGLRTGKRTQNVLTAAKLLGLAAIVATAISLPPPSTVVPIVAAPHQTLLLSLILVMFAYGGWSDMSFVAAEVRDPQRNIFRALLLGTLAVTATYLVVNLAFIWALGVGGLTQAKAVAAEVVSLQFGSLASTGISLLVVVSCLGAINGMIFTGARVFYALGTEHPTFRWLGMWNESTGVPLRSLLVQTAVTLVLLVGFGLGRGGFERLVIFTGPFYWGFIGLVGVALIVLRHRVASSVGKFLVPLYPLTPLVFAASSGAMVYAAIDYANRQRGEQPLWFIGASWAAAVVVSGIIVGIIDRRARQRVSGSKFQVPS